MTGYTALHESAAWFDLSSRCKLKITGEDRIHFIHAMSTNDVEQLSPGQGVETLFLNGRGQIQAETLALVTEECLLLDFDVRRKKSLPLHLAKYIVMDDVCTQDISSSLATIAIEGPLADQVVAAIASLPPRGKLNHISDHGLRIVRNSLSSHPGFWLLMPSEKKKKWIKQIEAANAISANADIWNTFRVENQIPLEGVDYPDTSIPQQANRLHAVSFNKGCYLGQEIVERVRSQGNLQKKLEVLEIDTVKLPPSGSPVVWRDKKIGRLTSPVFSPKIGKVLAFALLRDKLPREGSLIVDGHSAHIQQNRPVAGTEKEHSHPR